MVHLRHHRRAAGLLALLAMLALALVPTLSRALVPAAGPGNLAEVCTPQGLQRLPLQAPAPAVHVDACALCVLGGDGALPASAGMTLRGPVGTRVVAAWPTDGGPDRRRVWCRAAPRAPPRAA